MTTINKKVTKAKTVEKSVKVCDTCGLSENELPDDESIKVVQSNSELDVSAQIFTQEEEENSYKFDNYDDAKAFIDSRDDIEAAYTHYELSWGLEFDCCEHCIESFFSAYIG